MAVGGGGASPPGDGDGIGDRTELVTGEETSAVEPVVGFEGDAEEGAVRFHLEILLLAAKAGQLPIHRHEIAHFQVIARRSLPAPASDRKWKKRDETIFNMYREKQKKKKRGASFGARNLIECIAGHSNRLLISLCMHEEESGPEHINRQAGYFMLISLFFSHGGGVGEGKIQFHAPHHPSALLLHTKYIDPLRENVFLSLGVVETLTGSCLRCQSRRKRS